VSEPPAKPARRWWKYLVALAGASLLCIVALGIYINTDSFQALVRRRLVAEIERITGGRAEIGSFHTVPFHLQAEVRNITVHGRESADEIPLAHAESIVARLKIVSLLESEFAFHEVILEQPIVHIAFYPDGRTNLPLRADKVTGKASIEQLFALSITQLEIRQGRVIWDDQTIPLDFAARDTSLQMDYSYLHSRYDGRLLLGMVDTKLLDCRPFAWMSTADFSLTSDSATFNSLQWNSGHSHLSATGQIADFRHPRVHAAYDANIDLTEAASITRQPQLRAGKLEMKGDGSWSLDEFKSNGLLALRDVAWQNDDVAFSKAGVRGNYALTDQQLTLSKIQGEIFGGSFTGDAEWSQWLAPDQHLSASTRKILETATISAAHPKSSQAIKSKPSAIQNARISLKLRDFSVESVATALNAPTRPLQSLHPAGFASGSIETRWKGTRHDAETQFTLDVNPPVHTEPPQLPLTAHANGVYYSATDNLDLPQFVLTTPTSHMQASGTLSSTSALKLSVSTSSLADWLPFVAVVRGPELFPIALNGRATFNGNMTGSLSSPQLAGSLIANDFAVTIPATGKTPPLHTNWDSLFTSVQLSFHGIALHDSILRRGDTSAEFEASASLDHGHLVGDSTLNIDANVHSVDVNLLQSLAGYSYPLSGKGDLSFEAGGTFSDPTAEGKIHLANATVYGEPIQQLDSDFHWSGGEIALDDLHVAYRDSALKGRAAYNLNTRAYRFDVAGNNFDLQAIRQLQSDRHALEGRADFTLKGSGTPNAPAINGDVHFYNLALNHERLGNLDLHASTEGDQLHLVSNSTLQQSSSQQGSLQIAGNIGMHGDYPADLSIRMDQLDLDALWHSYLGNQLSEHATAAGTVNLQGPLFHPVHWTLDGELNSLALDLEHVKLRNQNSVRFTIANQLLTIPKIHMMGEGSDINAQGSMQLAEAKTLDISAEGRLDLKLLAAFDPNFAASGLMIMNLTVGGTFGDPLPQGRIQFSNGAISYSSFPSGLSDLNGTLLFTRDHAHIDALAARTGGGSVVLKGDATYVNQQLNFNLAASGKDVRLRYPPGVSSTADAELHWTGSRSASSIGGEITINKIAVTPGFDFSSYLERGNQGATLTVANSPLSNIKLDIHVQTSLELQMRTAIARLSGDADLRVRGSVVRPAILGRVDVLEGAATFHGTRFILERGDITFANPVSIEPQLNLQASTHVRNYDLNITVTGTPDRGLNLNYRSEPPLPKSDIIALLALGRTGDESAQLQEQSGQSTFSDQATALILSQALNTTVTSRFQRLFGASNIKIDPQGLTTENTPVSNSPQITIEQEFANNLALTYSTNVSQSSQQIIQGEYYFNRNLSVVGTRDQNGVISFDVRVRRHKK
jgi:translocation and assembly module TamB